ncbi:hypothetical protein D3C73_1407040 [compost metagenome]
MQFLIFLVILARLVTFATQGLHLFCGIPEDKDILRTHMLQHLDVGSVQRTDGQRTVQRKFHVTGPGGFGPGQ